MQYDFPLPKISDGEDVNYRRKAHRNKNTRKNIVIPCIILVRRVSGLMYGLKIVELVPRISDLLQS